MKIQTRYEIAKEMGIPIPDKDIARHFDLKNINEQFVKVVDMVKIIREEFAYAGIKDNQETRLLFRTIMKELVFNEPHKTAKV